MKALKAQLPLLALLLAVGGGVFAARRAALVETFELKTLDWRFRTWPQTERHDPRIVHVTIDQASLDKAEADGNPWPWSRDIYEPVFRFLKLGGAKVVVMDVLFIDGTQVDADKALARGVASHGGVVMAMESTTKADARRRDFPPESFSVTVPAGVATSALPSASVRLPIPPVMKAARLLGDTRAEPDPDGVFRRVPLVTSIGGRLYPTLPAAAAMLATGKTIGQLDPPLEGGRMLVRYHGKSLTDETSPYKTYAKYQFGDLVSSMVQIDEKQKPPLDPQAFKDKIVFIGMSAAGLLDNHPSPIDPVYPGTEVVASAADNLIGGDFLRRGGAGASLALVALAVLLAWSASRLSSHHFAALAVVAAGAGLLVAVPALAFQRGLWLDMVAPLSALGLSFAAASAYGFAVEGRQKRYIQGAFSFYLSPEIVKRIADQPDALKLGGERREATFYFSDIQGFTSFSEKLPPEKLTQLMNRYLGEMTDTILVSGGTLDKYIGDAIMSFWNAPLDCEGHELIACKAALDNQARLARLREEFDRLGYPPVKNRIGLNTGPAIIGNMGSPKRFSYTAIGDAVNLASRLEGANKAYGSYILISETTRAGAGAAIETRELDYVKVKGKAQPIRVYELLGLKGETDAALLEKARLFEAGLPLFRKSEFAQAKEAFRAVLAKFPDDHAAKKYVERCEEYEAEPPPKDWDGSNELTEK